MPPIRSGKQKSNTAKEAPSKSLAPEVSPLSGDDAPNLDEKYNKGDFKITTDGTVFLVQSFHMLAASTVLRDTLEIGTAGGELEIELDVRAMIVRIWLDAIVERHAPTLSVYRQGELLEVLRLCEKFDCPGVKKTIFSAAEMSLEAADGFAYDLLVAAALYGEPQQIVRCIRCHGDLCWDDDDADGPLGATSVLDDIRDVSAMSLQEFSRLPHEVLWALLRSFRSSSAKPTPEEEADKLEKLFDAIEASKSPPQKPPSIKPVTVGTTAV